MRRSIRPRTKAASAASLLLLLFVLAAYGTAGAENPVQQSCDTDEVNGTGAKGGTNPTIAELVKNEFPDLDSLDFSNSDEGETCYDKEGETRRLPLSVKDEDVIAQLRHERDPDRVALKLCTLDVSALRDKLAATWNETFDKELQARTNARFENRASNMERFKPGVIPAIFIFSDRFGLDVFYFPWLDKWLPDLEKTVLEPLRIDLNRIIRMQLALMTSGATINKHSDKGGWVKRTHRTHVPLFTHDDTYFVAESPRGSSLRIPSKVGAVYEFNNVVPHTVRNYGGDRVHLIIDWAEEPADNITKLRPGQVCKYMGNSGIYCDDDEDYEDEDYALNGREEL